MSQRQDLEDRFAEIIALARELIVLEEALPAVARDAWHDAFGGSPGTDLLEAAQVMHESVDDLLTGGFDA